MQQVFINQQIQLFADSINIMKSVEGKNDKGNFNEKGNLNR